MKVCLLLSRAGYKGLDGGGTVTTLSDAEIARWAEQISFMEADWIGRADARGLDGAALLDDLKATFSKYN